MGLDSALVMVVSADGAAGFEDAACPAWLGRFETDDDRLAGRAVAAHCRGVKRDQRVDLGVVSSCAPARGRISNEAEAGTHTFGPLVLTDQIDELPSLKTQVFDVVWVNEYDVPPALDPAIPIIVSVD